MIKKEIVVDFDTIVEYYNANRVEGVTEVELKHIDIKFQIGSTVLTYIGIDIKIDYYNNHIYIKVLEKGVIVGSIYLYHSMFANDNHKLLVTEYLD